MLILVYFGLIWVKISLTFFLLAALVLNIRTSSRKNHTRCQQLDTNTTPWSNISLDNFEFKGNKYLMILDTCTKFITVGKSDHFDTVSTTKILNSVFSEHGIPSSIRCDRGSNFLSDSFRHYAKVHKIDLSYSSAYHHSSNPARTCHLHCQESHKAMLSCK